jgi:Dolichyl-phosphate-mannose-protein mannosyltransferase
VARLRAIPGWAVVAALVAVSTLLRWWAASRVPTPWIVPDEVIYAKLGQSLYADGSFELLGEPTRFYSLLFPALIGLPLSLDDLALGYDLLKPLQALVMSLAAVPVYLWGRSLVSKWWALAAAALTLTIPGLAYSGLVMTEVLFYPVSALAVWAIASALARPTLARQALALASILIASATRLQGAVLGAVLVTALVLVAIFERDARRILRFWPALAGLALAAAGWVAWRLSGGGPASELFGAYRAAGEVGYTVSDTVLYTRWHLADVLLITGVIPACAVAVLVVEALAGRERSQEARAYLAVTTALVGWLVVQVGLFASRHVGRLAERDLLAVCPVLFLGLALWLDRGAPRPRLTTIVVAAAALGLVLWLPVGELVSHEAIPDAFTLIPLQRLQAARPDVDLQVVVDLVAALGVVAFVGCPRRFRWALPVAVGLVLSAVSVSASRVVASEATMVGRNTLGDTRRWIDEKARGPVTFLYSGEVVFSSVWENLFWNRRIARVYRLPGARVPGLTDKQQPAVGPTVRGDVLLADESRAKATSAVATSLLGLKGRQAAFAPGPALVLWRLDRPFRLGTWLRLENPGGGLFGRARFLIYACRGGLLEMRLTSPVEQKVVLRSDGRTAETVTLAPGVSVQASIRANPRPPPGRRTCTLEVDPASPIAIDQTGFDRDR